MKSILILVITALSFTTTIAQEGLNRHLEAANTAYNHQQYAIAAESFLKGYSKIKGKKTELRAEISFKIGECYRLNGDYRRSRVFYYRALRFDYATINPIVYLYYAQSLQMNENYEKAIAAYNSYLEYNPEATIAAKAIESCTLAEQWQENPTNFTVKNLYRINSPQNDFAPAYADKFYTSIIFTSNREETTGEKQDPWTNKSFSDLFYAKKDRQERWGEVVNIDKKEKVNTDENEGAPVLTKDFSAMYFTRCIKRKEKKAGCRIYKSTRSGMNWGDPKDLELSKDSSEVFGHPAINSDETLLIFATSKPGGRGGKDLYYSVFEDGKWQRPLNLSDNINTAGDELFPFLQNDSVLYFSSNGHVGMGGLDIFRSVKKDGKWQKPVNLQYPMNSVADDHGITMQPNRQEGYFASNRKGSRNDDIYYFINPPVEFTFKGNVIDQQTLQPVAAAEILLKKINKKRSDKGKTDEKGFFSYSPGQIDTESTYIIEITKPNYFGLKDTLSTVGVLTSTAYDKKYELQRIPDEPVVLPDILFDLGKWDLKEQYQDSLQGLISTLDANQNIVIELGAHTDARASLEYNDVLSQKRAEAVVDYLIQRGIDSRRLVAKGYGERKPRVMRKIVLRDGFTFAIGDSLAEAYINTLTTEQEQEIAHQLNRRIDFRVIRKDFQPVVGSQTNQNSAIALIKDPGSNKVNYIPGKGAKLLLPIILNGYTYNATYSDNFGELILKPSFAKELLNKGLIDKKDFDQRSLASLKRGNVPNQAQIAIDEIRIGATSNMNLNATVFKYSDDAIQIGPDFLKQFGEYEIDEENFQIIFKK